MRKSESLDVVLKILIDLTPLVSSAQFGIYTKVAQLSVKIPALDAIFDAKISISDIPPQEISYMLANYYYICHRFTSSE